VKDGFLSSVRIFANHLLTAFIRELVLAEEIRLANNQTDKGETDPSQQAASMPKNS